MHWVKLRIKNNPIVNDFDDCDIPIVVVAMDEIENGAIFQALNKI